MERLKGENAGHLSIIAANLIYGLNYTIAKGIMPDYFSPKAIIVFRVVGTFILFAACLVFIPWQKILRKDIWRFVLSALFGVSINQILFFEGLNLTTPIDSAIIMTVNPIMVLIFAWILLKENISLLKVSGIILGMSGALLIITAKGAISFGSEHFTGNVFIFINATSFAFYLVIVKPLMTRYHPLTVMFWVFGLGLLMVLPVCLPDFLKTDMTRIPSEIWWGLVYVIVFSTFFGYLLYNYGLRVLSASVTSTYIYLQPVFAGIAAFFFTGQIPVWTDYLAALMIFAGVYLTGKKKAGIAR
jgi:drug/metabolite transporter (DMT)-like permease